MTKLTPKQELTISALICEPTILLAAEKVGTSESTVHRWLREDTFNKAYKAARRTVMTNTISSLQQTTNEAIHTLKDVMSNKEAPANSRVSAARAILEMAFKAYEMDDLQQRVEEMEQYIEGMKSHG
jgi:hypothetical protein